MSAPPTPAVQVTGLRKIVPGRGRGHRGRQRHRPDRYRGGDLRAARAERRGKTTTLRILTTLLPADAGAAVIAGADVFRAPAQVRRRIGYVGQLGGADKEATGR